jgi:hypothetical protein
MANTDIDAHTDIDRFDIRPRIVSAAQRGVEIQRTHNMLVVSAIASMVIVVVATLFMTMF